HLTRAIALVYYDPRRHNSFSERNTAMTQIVQRKAISIWNGDLKSGSGTVGSTHAGSTLPFDLGVRKDPSNLNLTGPEQLLAAAHASCFSMSLRAELEQLQLAD